MMRRALDLAEKGLYTTTPNPRVGCVVVQGRGGRRRGLAREGRRAARRGRRARAGGRRGRGRDAVRHASSPATTTAARRPASTRSCKAKVARVVAAMRDPNPQGGARRRARSPPPASRFEHGLMEEEARELNIGFVSRMTRGRPWVRHEDRGDARRPHRAAERQARSGSPAPEARRDGHRWRARACAILTGVGTVRGRRSAPHGARGRDAAPAAARDRRQPPRDAAAARGS